MGVENNECVIATTWNDEAVETIQKWILSLSKEEQSLFAILPSLVNGKQTIVLAPDGSKKGWETAKQGEKLRNRFITRLEGLNYEDNSGPFYWVEVGYGEFGQKVLHGNCVNRYSDKEYAE